MQRIAAILTIESVVVAPLDIVITIAAEYKVNKIRRPLVAKIGIVARIQRRDIHGLTPNIQGLGVRHSSSPPTSPRSARYNRG
jgi:hypothetical protein